MITTLIGKGRDNALMSVTDDRRVVSDRIDFIEFVGCLVPVGIYRQIQ